MAKSPIIMDLGNTEANSNFYMPRWDTEYILYREADKCLYTIAQGSKTSLHFGYIYTNKSVTTQGFLQIEFAITNAPNTYFWVEETDTWFRFLEHRGNTDGFITVTVPLLDSYSSTWAMQIDFGGEVPLNGIQIRKIQVVFEESPPVEPSAGYKTLALKENIYSDSSALEMMFSEDTMKHYPLFYIKDITQYFTPMNSFNENGITNNVIPKNTTTEIVVDYDAACFRKGYIEFDIYCRSNPMPIFAHDTYVEVLKKDGTRRVIFYERSMRDYAHIRYSIQSDDVGKLIFKHQSDPDVATSADRINIKNLRLSQREYQHLKVKERIYSGGGYKSLLLKEKITYDIQTLLFNLKERIIERTGASIALIEDVYRSADSIASKLDIHEMIKRDGNDFDEAFTDLLIQEWITSKSKGNTALDISTNVLNNISYALFKSKQKDQVHYKPSQYEGILAYYQVIPDLPYLMFSIKCSTEAVIECADFDNPNLESGADVYYLGPAKVLIDDKPAIGKPIGNLDTTTHLFVCKRATNITVDNPCINFYISNSTIEPYVEAVYYADDKNKYSYETENLLLQEKVINQGISNPLLLQEFISNSLIYEDYDYFKLYELIQDEKYTIRSSSLGLKEMPIGTLWNSSLGLREWVGDDSEVILKDLYRRVGETNTFKPAGNTPYDLTEPLYVEINKEVDYSLPLHFDYNILKQTSYKWGWYHICYKDNQNRVQHDTFKDPYNDNINFSSFLCKFLDNKNIPHKNNQIIYLGINLVDVWIDNLVLSRSRINSQEFAIKETVLERGTTLTPEFLYYTFHDPLTLKEVEVVKPLLNTPIGQPSVDSKYYTSISFKNEDQSIPTARILDGIYLEITKPVKVLINEAEVTNWALEEFKDGIYRYQITDMALRCNNISDIFAFVDLNIDYPNPVIRRFEVAYSHFPYKKNLGLKENITQIVAKRMLISERIIDKAFNVNFPIKENLLNMKMNIYYLFMKEKIIRDGDKEGHSDLLLQEFIERPMTKDNLLILDLVPTEPIRDKLPIMEYASLKTNEEIERLSARERVLEAPFSGCDKKVIVEIIR